MRSAAALSGKVPNRSEAQKVTYWSARLVMLWVLLFALTMVLGLFGVATGPLAFLVCLLLAPSFVGMMAGLHQQAPPEKRVWSQLGLSFAVIYAVLVGGVYYVQLSALRAAADELLPFVYTPGSVFFALNMLGYAFMCLSTWCAASVFTRGDRLTLWIRRLFIVHGWMVFPTLIFPLLVPYPSAGAGGDSDIFGSLALLLWCLIFIPLAHLVSRYCR